MQYDAPEGGLLPGVDGGEVEHTASRVERVVVLADDRELLDVVGLEHPHVPPLAPLRPAHALL